MSYQKKRFKKPYKGRRQEAPPPLTKEQRISALFVRIGDKPQSLTADLNALLDTLGRDMDTASVFIIDLILQCVAELPLKTTVYATLVGLINVRHPATAKALVERLGGSLTNGLLALATPGVVWGVSTATANRRRVRLLVRFVACLCTAGVVTVQSTLDLFEMWLDVAGSALRGGQDGDVVSADPVFLRRAEFYAGLVCDALAWSGKKMAKQKKHDLAALMDKLAAFFALRGDRITPVGLLALKSGDAEGMPRCTHDPLRVRWQQLLEQQDTAWAMHAQIDAMDPFETQLDAVSTAYAIHDYVALPAFASDTSSHYGPQVAMLELISDEERANGLAAGEVAVVREYVRDVLDAFNSDHKGASKFLRILPLPRGLVDKGADALILECLFQELLSIPWSTYPMPFYVAVIGGLCSAAPETVPRAFGKIAMRMYKCADDLDVGVLDRFVRYLALHLSNFEYNWAWQKWAQTRTFPDDDAKRLMCDQVIQACVRLSYVAHIRDKLPEDLHDALPPETTTPVLSHDDADGTALYESLHTHHMDQDKVAVQLATAYGAYGMSDVCCGAGGLDYETQLTADESQRRVCAFFEALLRAGQQSFGHLQLVLERYVLIAQALGQESAQARAQIAATVADVWSLHPQQHMIAIDRLQKYNVVDPLAILDWAFDLERVHHFRHGHIRDIVRNTIIWAVKAANASMAKLSNDSANPLTLGAVQALNEALVHMVDKAVQAIPTAKQNAVTWRMMHGTVLDLVRMYATPFQLVRERIEAIDDIEELDLLDALNLANVE